MSMTTEKFPLTEVAEGPGKNRRRKRIEKYGLFRAASGGKATL